jgi:hypothetical protein
MTPLEALQSLASSWKPKADLTKSYRGTNPVMVFEEYLLPLHRAHNEKLLSAWKGEFEKREGNYVRIVVGV